MLIYKHKSFNKSKIILIAVLSLTLTSCANKPDVLKPEVYNSKETAYIIKNTTVIERINRVFFRANLYMDWYFLRPVTLFYNNYVPTEIHKGLINFYNYANEPSFALNRLLIGDIKKSINLSTRFFINTIFGFGVIDWASEAGIKPDKLLFNYVLANYNISNGTYFVLPSVGAATTRSLAGTLTDTITKNLYLNSYITMSLAPIRALLIRSALFNQENMIYKTVDPYILFKSAYQQNIAFNESVLLSKSINIQPDVDINFED